MPSQEKDYWGITELPQCENDLIGPEDRTRVDIVAVHGLNGHAINTWTDDLTQKCWIRDYLPASIKGARILVFGYNANVGFHGAVNDLRDVATNLVNELNRIRMRRDQQKRPIIFLAHSLGGIVVKKSVLLETENARKIAAAVQRFIFFATPHGGSGLANFAEVILKHDSIFGVPNNFIRVLCTDSDELTKINAGFVADIKRRGVQSCACLYELFPTKMGLNRGTIVVHRESAILGIGEAQEGLYADHKTIVKYPSNDDKNYKTALSFILEAIELITKNNAQKARPKLRNYAFAPSPSPFFVARPNVFSELSDFFFTGTQHHHNSLLLYSCERGTGKTQLALNFIQVYQTLYDYLIFLNASSMESLRSDIRSFQLSLNSTGSFPEGEDPILGLRDWFESINAERWLVVFDNIDHLSGVLPAIEPFMFGGDVLLTSHDPSLLDTCLFERITEVKAMTIQECLKLLYSKTDLDPGDRDSDAMDLVQSLGQLPLAIDLAGAYINSRDSSLKECRGSLETVSKESSPSDTESSIQNNFVPGLIEMNFKLVSAQPSIACFISLLVALGPNAVNDEFLHRGTSSQVRWSQNGEVRNISPQEDNVSDDLIRLFKNQMQLDETVNKLEALSLIRCRTNDNGERTYCLAPMIHDHLSRSLTEHEKSENTLRVVCFLMHAYPADIYGLETTFRKLGQEYLLHVYHAYDLLHESLDHDIIRREDIPNAILPFASSIANMFIDALNCNTKYGDDRSSINTEILDWITKVAKALDDVYLLGRVTQLKARIHQYRDGNYIKAKLEIFHFLAHAEKHFSTSPATFNELTNSQVGYLKRKVADLLCDECDADSDHTQSLTLLREWKPLNPEFPSTKERVVMGITCQTIGKIFKDEGSWKDAETELRRYLANYAIANSEPEGYAAGDLAHVLMEIANENRTEPDITKMQEVENLLAFHLHKRLDNLPPSKRNSMRRGDTTFLEIQYGECLILQKRFGEAEKVFSELRDRFQHFGRLNYIEKTRFFFILCGSARCAQTSKLYKTALGLWMDASKYATTTLDTGYSRGKFNRHSYYHGVVLLSMAVCNFVLGSNDDAKVLREEAEKALREPRLVWWAGLGTYWRSEMERTELLFGGRQGLNDSSRSSVHGDHTHLQVPGSDHIRSRSAER